MTFHPAVPTLLLEGDRLTLIAVRDAVATRLGSYTYLEIGSYLGGSLQPHLLDPRCTAVYSIDSRPEETPDIRDPKPHYERNTTAEMRRLLAEAHGPSVLAKMRTFDSDAADVPTDSVTPLASLCFIDGEHTDAAVLRDFQSAQRMSTRPCVIAFDDADLIYGGLAACIGSLKGQEFTAYVLPSKIGVIELGLPIHEDPTIARMLLTMDAHLYAMTTLDRYRVMALEYERLRSMVRRAVPGIRHVAALGRRIMRLPQPKN